MDANECEPLMISRNADYRDDVKTGFDSNSGVSSQGPVRRLNEIRHIDGVITRQALDWNRSIRRWSVKGAF